MAGGVQFATKTETINIPVVQNVKLEGGTIIDAKIVDARAIMMDQQTVDDAVSGVLTFDDYVTIVDIYNRDASNDGVFTINGFDITIPAGGFFYSEIGGVPSKQITVTGSTDYIVGVYKLE